MIERTPKATRALAAAEAIQRVSDWGEHSYIAAQSTRLTRALVDALVAESDNTARESIVNVLATLVRWDLAPGSEVARALAVPRPDLDHLAAYWAEIAECARRRRPNP